MKDYKSIYNFSDNKIKELMAIKPENLDVKFKNEFTDDHLPCVNVIVNGIKVSFWWLETEEAAAFRFADESERAKNIVAKCIKKICEMELDERG